MMKKLKLLGLVGLMVCGFVFSCTLPMETIEPKINEVKLNPTFKKITDMVVDSNGNIYILDNNVIKKLDSNGELTIIAGKEKILNSNNESTIDGDIKIAKFGQIKKIQYVENEKTVYFVDSIEKENISNISDSRRILIRKINKDNKVETIFNEDNSNYSINIDISKNGYFYIVDNPKFRKIDTNLKEIKNEKLSFPNSNFDSEINDVLEDSEDKLYFIISSTSIRTYTGRRLYFKSNLNKMVEFEFGKAGSVKNIILDGKGNIYINYIEGDLRMVHPPPNFLPDPRNILPKINIIRSYIYKLQKKDLENYDSLSSNEKLELMKKSILGDLPSNNFEIYSIDSNKNIIYASDEKNIYKINIKK